MDEQRIKNLIKVWYENKAKMELDPIFKFLCLWICFNAWLDYKSDKDKDSDMIDWLVSQSLESSDLVYEYQKAQRSKSFIDDLKSLAIESQKKPIESGRGQHRSIIIKDENDFENIVWAIYKVRCNLFHGYKTADESRDQKLIKVCGDILTKWIGNLIVTWR